MPDAERAISAGFSLRLVPALPAWMSCRGGSSPARQEPGGDISYKVADLSKSMPGSISGSRPPRGKMKDGFNANSYVVTVSVIPVLYIALIVQSD
jgi:hypothetical protein